MPDVEEHCWMFRFIAHEYSVPVDFQASRKVLHNRARHDLDTYVWSLPDQIRSRCSTDNVFKKLSFVRCAMEMTLPHDCELLTGEFADREKNWISYYSSKEVVWHASPAFLLKLGNDGVSD